MDVHSGEIIKLVEQWSPMFITYGIIVLAIALALRLLLAIFQKRSALLRLICWLAAISCIGGITATWLVTGQVPDIPAIIQSIWNNSAAYLPDSLPDSLAALNLPGLITLAIGAFLSIFARPISFMFTPSRDRDGIHDSEIIVRTIGWLVVIVGVLMAIGLLSFGG